MAVATTSKIKDAAAEFLEHQRVAVTGVSRTPGSHGSNVVFDRLKDRGYEVFPVNPQAEMIDEIRCFPDLKSIPGGIDAVVIATAPEHAMATMHEAVDLGVKHVWMHRSFGGGSVSAEAAQYGRDHGITVIEGGCPLMFGPTSDPGHKFMCAMLKLTGKVPRKVTAAA